MILQLKAKHFRGAIFESPCNCPVAISAKEAFNTKEVTERVYNIVINDVLYLHDYYSVKDCEDVDTLKAIAANFDETVIREIELFKV